MFAIINEISKQTKKHREMSQCYLNSTDNLYYTNIYISDSRDCSNLFDSLEIKKQIENI